MVNIREVVEMVIRNHPKECIFTPNAVGIIISGSLHCKNTEEIIDYLEEAIQKQEIYCPHEKIDRRKEFGLI